MSYLLLENCGLMKIERSNPKPSSGLALENPILAYGLDHWGFSPMRAASRQGGWASSFIGSPEIWEWFSFACRVASDASKQRKPIKAENENGKNANHHIICRWASLPPLVFTARKSLVA
jgi:hypothetical protein